MSARIIVNVHLTDDRDTIAPLPVVFELDPETDGVQIAEGAIIMRSQFSASQRKTTVIPLHRVDEAVIYHPVPE